MSDYRNTSTHAVTLASGRPLGPGESAPLVLIEDEIDPHDKALIDGGTLIEVEPAKGNKPAKEGTK